VLRILEQAGENDELDHLGSPGCDGLGEHREPAWRSITFKRVAGLLLTVWWDLACQGLYLPAAAA
jgi:hypothetical protein